ncbi:manganese peroxidase 2 [Roridomyces roridus]|uniref:Peroxidase n=1 Tax=Roridomyces roridus TaxID=1738132 RepID=A0AAD7FE62_9AGAR|nr:manganese peroxidase 2 [Roridomyces roridus]
MTWTSLVASLALTAAISGVANAAATIPAKHLCPDGKNSASNPKCCALFPVLEDIQANMFGDSGCGDAAHAILRVAFHDAIGFSQHNPKFGTGADGSMFIFGETEIGYDANLGIADAFNLEAPFIEKHRGAIGVGDFIQFAAAVGLTKCPGVLQPPFLLGRVDAKFPAPDGTVPEAFQSAQTILARMADAGLTAADTVALLASHSIAGADDVDPDAAGVPFDSTPSLFDTQFYLETLLIGNKTLGGSQNKGEEDTPIKGELRLQSDFALARDPATACLWQGNVNNQAKMAQAFQKSFYKMQSLGQNVAKMTDCSEVIPAAAKLSAAQAQAFFPPTLTSKDVQQVCKSPFPHLPTKPGPAESIQSIVQDPKTQGSCDDNGTDCILPPA